MCKIMLREINGNRLTMYLQKKKGREKASEAEKINEMTNNEKMDICFVIL